MILTHPLFWKALRESGSVDESRGMELHEFEHQGSRLVTFSKTHSYGEFIFDWQWAEAYRRVGIPYYPKLTSMVPFTPATAPHFWGPDSHWPELLRQHDELLATHSGAHFLFITPEEELFLRDSGYMLRSSFQYHFLNDHYGSFEDFLSRLKGKKAKNIRKERLFPGLSIERLTGDALLPSHADEMYDHYLRTLEKKGAIPYLTRIFFRTLFTELRDHLLYVRAGDLAGALFYYDEARLYGRYWGSRRALSNLHFELCYYQGIEFAIERKIPVFEAGAQGEHKIARGFRPVLTASAHKICHPEFSRAISEFIREEKKVVERLLNELRSQLPFR